MYLYLYKEFRIYLSVTVVVLKLPIQFISIYIYLFIYIYIYIWYIIAGTYETVNLIYYPLSDIIAICYKYYAYCVLQMINVPELSGAQKYQSFESVCGFRQ